MKVLSIIISIPFLIFGAVLLSILANSSYGTEHAVANFLLESYSYMAYGVPLFYFWLFFLFFTKSRVLIRVLWPLLSLVPFFILSLAMKIQFATDEATIPLAMLVKILGKNGAVFFMYSLGFFTILGIFIIFLINKISSKEAESYITSSSSIEKTMPQSKSNIISDQSHTINQNTINQNPPLPTRDKVYSPTPSYPHSQSSDNQYLLVFNKKKRPTTPNAVANHIPSSVLLESDANSPSTSNQKKTITYEYKDLESSEFVGNYIGSTRSNPPEATYTNENVAYSMDIEDIDTLGKDRENLELNESIDQNEYNTSFNIENNLEENVGLDISTSDIESNLEENMGLDISTSDSLSHKDHTIEETDVLEQEHEYDFELSDNEDDELPYEITDNDRVHDTTDYEREGDYLLDSNQQLEHSQHETEDNDCLDEGMEGDSYASSDFMTLASQGEENKLPEDIVVQDALEEIKQHTTSSHKKRKIYTVPILGILDSPTKRTEVDSQITEQVARILELTLQEFNIDAKVIGVCRGPVVTMFEILPSPGVRLRRIVELSDNIALRLAASSIRIVAPIPGKEAVGIEVPNKDREEVSFSELISHRNFNNKNNSLSIALGKNIANEIQILDLSKTPHLLIAGATGSGKSVCINAIICSLLYFCNPDEVKLILIDPKIVELSFYNDIRHLLTPVISDPVQSLQALRWCIDEMEKRYQQLEYLNVREIRSYNKKVQEKKSKGIAKMPFIVVVIDEFADLMMTCGKEIESLVSRLTAKSRAVGIHIVIATQRPSTDVITGLIKANIPTRVSFMVTSKTDSRIILDMNGAENLLGRGDMLFSSASNPFPERLQGPYLTESEVQRIVEYVKEIGGDPEYISDEIFSSSEEGDGETDNIMDDSLWDSALEEVVQSKKASASHLQRRLKIGYNRAARLVEEMENRGMVGPQQGSKPREVYID